MIGTSIGSIGQIGRASVGLLIPPTGYAFLVDNNGTYITDTYGVFLLVRII